MGSEPADLRNVGAEEALPRMQEEAFKCQQQRGEASLEQNAERKATEDPSAIIESLRARLLSERNSSRAAKQQAQVLSRKVRELEQVLEEETQSRRRCGEIMQKLVDKLDSVQGIEGLEELKQMSKDWLCRSLPGTMQILDGKADGHAASKRLWSITGSRHGRSRSFSGSSASDLASIAQRRVGVSCRRIRKRESEVDDVDEQVKGTWSTVVEDVSELAKLRSSNDESSESGWVRRAAETLEARSKGETEFLESVDSEDAATNTQEKPNLHDERSTSPDLLENVQAAESSQGQFTISEGSRNLTTENEDSMGITASASTEGCKYEPERIQTKVGIPEQRYRDSTAARKEQKQGQDDDIEELLQALTFAKQQLRYAQVIYPAAPMFSSSESSSSYSSFHPFCASSYNISSSCAAPDSASSYNTSSCYSSYTPPLPHYLYANSPMYHHHRQLYGPHTQQQQKQKQAAAAAAATSTAASVLGGDYVSRMRVTDFRCFSPNSR